jgi:manganese oxidase
MSTQTISPPPTRPPEGSPNELREFNDTAFMAMLSAGLAVALAIIAIGLSFRSRGGNENSTKVAAAPVATASVIDVKLSDFKVTPSRSSFPSGQVKLQIRNVGTTVHRLKIDGIADTGDMKAGRYQVLDLGVLEPGTYTWYCPVSGHVDAGMTGKFTVTERVDGNSPGVALAGGASGEPVTEPIEEKVDLDGNHAKVVKQFLSGPPAKTAGRGGLPIEASLENGIKVINLTAKVVQWEVAPGKTYEAWTYNGAVPGPQIRIKQGETVKVRLTNNLPESTSIHWHGLEMADNKQDGVTFVTQDPIKPGATYEYVLTPVNCGSHMYHSHHAADTQVPLGLLGAFIVDCTTTPVPAFAAHDTESTQILNDGPLGFAMNGKGFPATFPIVAKQGERTLVRFMNEGLIIHPMHLHGHKMTVVAKDGYFLPQPYDADTLNIAPGERYDVIVTSLYPGAWAFHCHILTHAESDEGLHGMTTVWLVQPK